MSTAKILTLAVRTILRKFGVVEYVVTRPADGSTRRVKMAAVPYSPESASMFNLEGSVNVSEAADYIMLMEGTPDVQEGDLFPLLVVQRTFTYRLLLPVSAPLIGGAPYTASIAVRYKLAAS